MLPPEKILDRLVLVGGPPRSGTTFAAKALNAHPRIVTAMDDPVHECWALYHYPTRRGLVDDLRQGSLMRAEVVARLKDHLFAGDRFAGVAPSAKTESSPISAAPPPPAGIMPGERKVIRHALPLARFAADWRLCLKSPEISFVLPRLADLLPSARFVLVFRPLAEIAESMFRKSRTVRRQPVFNRRWEGETDGEGRLLPPPGVPAEWTGLWRQGTGFQRCVLNAAAYARAMASGCAALPAERFFVYDHARLRTRPEPLLCALAAFLGLDAAGFAGVAAALRPEVPALTRELEAQFEPLREELGLEALADGLAGLAAQSLSRWGGAGRPA